MKYVMLVLMLLSSQSYAVHNSAVGINLTQELKIATHRLIKHNCQIGLGENYLDSRAALKHTAMVFDSKLKQLKVYADIKGVAQPLQKVEVLGSEYKKNANSQYTLKNAEQMLLTNRTIISELDKIIAAITIETGTSHGELVNIASNKRVQAQELTMLYLLRHWGNGSEAITQTLLNINHKLLKDLDKIQNAPGNSKEVISDIKLIRKNLNFLQGILGVNRENLSFTIDSTAERIDKAMENFISLHANMESHEHMAMGKSHEKMDMKKMNEKESSNLMGH